MADPIDDYLEIICDRIIAATDILNDLVQQNGVLSKIPTVLKSKLTDNPQNAKELSSAVIDECVIQEGLKKDMLKGTEHAMDIVINIIKEIVAKELVGVTKVHI